MDTERTISQQSPNPVVAPSEVPWSVSDEHLLTRVRSEFVEMPCLCLTAPQAQRLFGLTSQQCERVMGRLVASGFLSFGYGVFRRHTGT
jgi:hypothetical protein